MLTILTKQFTLHISMLAMCRQLVYFIWDSCLYPPSDYQSNLSRTFRFYRQLNNIQNLFPRNSITNICIDKHTNYNSNRKYRATLLKFNLYLPRDLQIVVNKCKHRIYERRFVESPCGTRNIYFYFALRGLAWHFLVTFLAVRFTFMLFSKEARNCQVYLYTNLSIWGHSITS